MQAVTLNNSTSVKLKIQPKKQENEEYRVTADNYSGFDEQRDHIYEVPQMYLGGSIKQMTKLERVLNLETQLFEDKEISVSDGLERIFVEISSNAGDNAARSMRNNVDPGEVTVTMTDTTIKVRNGGIPIPVEIKKWKKETMYVPEMIFGKLMTSSNYDKDKVRTEAGVNGYGAKLTNIFSKFFKVTIGDPHNESLYTQVWTENMKNKESPKIVHYNKNSKGFVEVEYTIDFLKFGYNDMKFPKEAYEFFARHIIDMAFTLKIPVSFNGKKYVIKNAKDYAKLYLGKEKVKNSILYCSWPKGTETYMKNNVELSKDKNILPEMEICAIDTPDEAFKISFLNAMWTKNNGVHYEAAFKAVANSVLNTVNDNKNGKKKKKKDDKTPKLALADVKKHVSIIISCWVEDPEFSGQGKSELKAPTPKVTIDEKILKPILNWDLVSRLYAELDAKQFRLSMKTDGKKTKNLSGMDKLKDANKAGTPESSECTLYITEGDSALTFAKHLRSFIPGEKGNDYVGCYPLKGKPINIMNATPMKVNANKEINDLKKILALKSGVDYSVEENYQTLRYGHLMVLADADTDGKHILGLVMNIFHCEFPSLIARGYITYLRTKILEVKKGKNKIKFYSQHDYDLWKEKTKDFKSWEHSYFKGLGTSEEADVEDESKNPKIVQTIYDEIAPYSMRLAFDKKLTHNRKDWIAQWQPDYTVEQMMSQPISSFINHEFIQFSIADVARSIPRFTDGLKVSQRKILWTAIKRWGRKAGDKAEKMKVAQFAASVSEKMAYMHGEKSLEGAIVGMGQSFVGSNNIPHFRKKGNFGTRSMLGKDASSGRYIFAAPEIFVPLIYKKEDENILNIIVDEGQDIEPVTLLPILPIHLINGVCGIGTGSSSYIPPHNPLEICFWLECKIKGISLPNLKPWFRGFNGKIEMKLRMKNANSESEEDQEEDIYNNEDEDEEDKDQDLNFVDENTKISMSTYGIYEEQGNSRKKITVTELPIGRSIDKYEIMLKKMRENKLITKYDDYSTAEAPKFEIYGMKNPSLKKLKLIKTYGMSNMVLLDNDNRPVKYKNANDIMETFYSIRLSYYDKRKKYILKNIQETIQLLNLKIKFILSVLKGIEMIQENSNISLEDMNKDGGILTIGKNKQNIMIQMNRCGFDEDLLKKISLYNLTKEETDKFKEEINQLENEYKIKEETKPEQFWLDDISEFVKVYCKHYKCNYESPKKIVKL